ncbi:multidrug/hemolysin transport system permease protein [Microbacterium testaceum]|uniref:ABC transporter permease n=1 Tax=Microbacterium TaxID=33882 RepID=UPI0027822C81|nr:MULTISPECIES: ABC transporter permease [Microbacterium]MDQ1110999.1 multidrug/hemolysin transport system permease protein [Microbacterium testaceum]MDR6098461.1 multidrug/hemolysin transport system permease protein [Microbacterium sp. SORGH_AS_0454]
MTSVAALTSRNLRLFFRDRAGVFFSLLSALILIGLYALFLGNLQVDNLTESLPTASVGDIRWFVTSWVFAGITMIVTVTTPLAALSVFVDDRASGRFSDFVVSPVRRVELILGYLASSFLISVTMTAIVFLAGQLYLLAQGHAALNPEQIATAFGRVALSCLTYAAMSSFVVTFIRTSGAFAALSTVVGTIIGFLAGAYIPAGTLPAGVVQVLNALPFAQAAMLIRQPMTAPALDAVTNGQPLAVDAVSAFYGVTARVGDLDVTAGIAIAALLCVVVMFTALGSWRLSMRIR